MSSFDAQLALVVLDAPGTFIFDLFPAKVGTSDRANWEPQDVTIGTKPLYYGNRDPRRITFPECWLDGTSQGIGIGGGATGQSITPQIKALRKLMDETKNGAPPALLAMWGDRQERCVLNELSIDEIFFDTDGAPLRAQVNLTLLQFQEERESVTVSVTGADESGSGIGDF